MADLIEDLRVMCRHDESGLCQCAPIRAADALEKLIAELTEAQDLAGHWAIATLEAQYQLREQAEGHRKAAEFLRIERDEYRRQRDIAVAALEKVSALEGTEDNEWDCVERVTPLMATTAREALKEIGEIK